MSLLPFLDKEGRWQGFESSRWMIDFLTFLMFCSRTDRVLMDRAYTMLILPLLKTFLSITILLSAFVYTGTYMICLFTDTPVYCQSKDVQCPPPSYPLYEMALFNVCSYEINPGKCKSENPPRHKCHICRNFSSGKYPHQDIHNKGMYHMLKTCKNLLNEKYGNPTGSQSTKRANTLAKNHEY